MSVFTNPASGAQEDAEAYINAVLDLVANVDPWQVLSTTARRLEELMSGLTTDQLLTAEAPGKWCMAEVAQHLADAELVWGFRLRMTLAENRPRLVGYDQDAWAARLGYKQAIPAESVLVFKTLREANLRLLHAAEAADLNRVAVHDERGEESIRHMIDLYAGHDIVHLRQLERIRAAI